MIAMVIVKDRASDDKFPIYLRPDCERTFFDAQTGKDMGLLELIKYYDERGWDVIF